MHPCHLHRTAPRGFTLPEVLVSSAIASMTLMALLSFYIMGIKFLRTGMTLTFQQQALTSAMEQIVELVRPATRIGIRTVPNFPLFPGFPAYATFTSNVTSMGNCLLIIDQFQKNTSMVCQISNMVYFLPCAMTGKTDRCRPMSASVLPRANMFSISNNSIMVRLSFVDPILTTKVVISSETLMSPRNIRGKL